MLELTSQAAVHFPISGATSPSLQYHTEPVQYLPVRLLAPATKPPPKNLDIEIGIWYQTSNYEGVNMMARGAYVDRIWQERVFI